MPSPLLIRADASPDIGLGHVMRTLALAQANGGACYATHRPDVVQPLLQARLTGNAEVCQVPAPPGRQADAQATFEHARHRGIRHVLLDGYQFDQNYVEHLRSAGLVVAFMTDLGTTDPIGPDLLINQNLHAHETMYPNVPAFTRKLLGNDYVLIRQDILDARRAASRRKDKENKVLQILVTFGGTTHPPAMQAICEALSRYIEQPLHASLLVPNSPDWKEKSPFANIKIEGLATDFPARALRADFVITGAGSTCWELAYLGVPYATVTLADNQRPIAASLAARDAAVDLGEADALTADRVFDRLGHALTRPQARRSLVQAGRGLVDGRGAQRVLNALLLL